MKRLVLGIKEAKTKQETRANRYKTQNHSLFFPLLAFQFSLSYWQNLTGSQIEKKSGKCSLQYHRAEYNRVDLELKDNR